MLQLARRTISTFGRGASQRAVGRGAGGATGGSLARGTVGLGLARAISSEANGEGGPDTKDFLSRGVKKLVEASEQSEGAGARVRRSIGTYEVRNFDPFLMLDHFHISDGAGFPDHPHRGQETITYMLEGNVDHEDFTGSSGTIGPGDLQFMTAGRGIMHAEMPRESADGKNPVGMQLWVDLPKKLKDTEPRYRDLRADEIPIARPNDNVEIKVISGRSHGVESLKDLAYTPVWYFDVRAKAGETIVQEFPADFNVFAYVLEGKIKNKSTSVPQYHTAFFDTHGDGVVLQAEEDSRYVLIGGQQLNQPIVQHGPFVETSPLKVMKAFYDFSNATNGFERAKGWQSEIGKR